MMRIAVDFLRGACMSGQSARPFRLRERRMHQQTERNGGRDRSCLLAERAQGGAIPETAARKSPAPFGIGGVR